MYNIIGFNTTVSGKKEGIKQSRIYYTIKAFTVII